MYYTFYFLSCIVVLNSAAPTWTYHDTTSSCLGTSASPCGPSYWSKMYPMCLEKNSSIQSPINIGASNVILSHEIQAPILKSIDGGCKAWTQSVFLESAFDVSFQANNCENLYVSFNGSDYIMHGLRFHSPSEHTIAGGSFAGEVQITHRNNNNQKLVISVFLEENPMSVPGTGNEFLGVFWSAGGNTAAHLSVSASKTNQPVVNPYTSFTPPHTAQYYYAGSSTAPNCEENVHYFIYEQPVRVSPEDIALMRGSVAYAANILSATGGNNRPVQALNGRSVYYLSGGVLPTATPTVAPTLRPSTLPTEAPVLVHRHLHRARPGTALTIGVIALAMAVVLIVCVGYLLVGLIKGFFADKLGVDRGYDQSLRWLYVEDDLEDNWANPSDKRPTAPFELFAIDDSAMESR